MSTSTFRRTNFSGYLVLDPAALLAELAAAGITPAYEQVVAHHVTYSYPDSRPAPPADRIRVVGHACAGGVQALLVDVDGTTHRDQGGRFHLTLSLAPGRRPVESNALLASARIDPVTPIDVPVTAF